jgi:hypothetical protein
MMHLDAHLSGEKRYRLNDAFAVAHGYVITPCNRMTSARRHALPCATANAPFNLSN